MRLYFGVFVLVFCLGVSGAQKRQSKKKLKKNPTKKSQLFGGSLSYSANTNLADQAEPRVYSHSISGMALANIDKGHKVSASSSISYVTIKDDIVRTHEDEDYFEVSNFALSYSVSLWKYHKHSLANSFSVFFPTSTPAQYEGYLSNTSNSLRHSYSWTNFYTMSHRLSVSYLMNRYKYSPVTGSPNQSWAARLGQSHSFRIGKYFSFSLSGGIKRTNYLDESKIDNFGFSFSHGVSVGMQLDSFSLGLGYHNGGHTTDNSVDRWYVDEGRKIVRLGVSYAF